MQLKSESLEKPIAIIPYDYELINIANGLLKFLGATDEDVNSSVIYREPSPKNKLNALSLDFINADVKEQVFKMLSPEFEEFLPELSAALSGYPINRLHFRRNQKSFRRPIHQTSTKRFITIEPSIYNQMARTLFQFYLLSGQCKRR